MFTNLGILISNRALQMLFEDQQRRFHCQYLLTRRLNQDVIENFFGIIRAKGGLHDHPSPLEFKYRLRSYILGKNEGAYSEYSNVEVDDTPDVPLSGSLLKIINPSHDTTAADDSNNEDHNMLTEELNDLAYDGLENLAGFVCHKLKNFDLQSFSNESFSWIDHLSEGGLSKPSSRFMAQIEELNRIFLLVNGDGLATGNNYIKNLLTQSSNVFCPIKAKRLFFRSRMFFRIRELNNALKCKPTTTKKWNKIIY